MCYASPVMLRGRRASAISERRTPSFVRKKPLSPIIPVHPRNSPVSPIIPVHTQKQGGGALLLNLRLLTLNPFSPLSLIIPAHTRRLPVSPMIPALTQNMGGGGGYLYGNVFKICRRADILVLLRDEQKEPKSTGRNACATNGERKAGTTCRAPTGGREPEEPTPRGGIGHYISDPKTQVKSRTWGTRLCHQRTAAQRLVLQYG